MMKILKASAGSGKTYRLAQEYIRQVLGDPRPDAYRHVLAVTFTNKATDEMKRRILEQLHRLATAPEKSPYFKELVPAVLPDASALQKKARQQLSGILHDYSAFAVSTIDRFFQQTLRAFSREIGQLATYQVQLDREALVTESVDRVLDGLTAEDRSAPLLDWLTRSVREDLERTGKFSLEGRLQEMAGSLQELPPGPDPFPRESLERLRKHCRGIVESYGKQVTAAAQEALDVLSAAGVRPEDSNRGFLKALYNYIDLKADVTRPTDAFLSKAGDPQQWFAKTKSALLQRVEGVLDGPLTRFTACFGLPYKEYRTARILLGQIYGLGVAGQLREALVAIQKEQNLLSIDDSNTILRDIIDGTPAPFIYEKLGVRYDHFLLDEFQDTADIQWENFRPLLHESEAKGFDSLVVGDVKQSIYRWRGSDWNLLGSRLQQEFRRPDVEVLGSNWRTCREIVEFNNRFFPFAAEQLDALLGEDPAAEGSISRLYADVCQQVAFPDAAPGSVEVCFTADQMEEILATIRQQREAGAAWSQLAILVRGNAEGSAIAARLVEEGIPVVSDDSLFVKSSVTVRRLVSQLSLVDAPPAARERSAAGFLARELQLELPQEYHSLVDLAEGLLEQLRAADPASFDAEIPYIQSFMDYLQDWVASGGGNKPGAFLRSWAEADPKIASPQATDSVRVMTVHKAKGLEFPFVIVPFAEKVTLYKASTYWCKPAAEGTALEGTAEGPYRVSLDGGAEDTLFAERYRTERKLQAVDNINVFYVALTRAKYGLKVIATPPPKNSSGYKNLSQILYDFVGSEHYFTGEAYPLGSLPAPRAESGLLESDYPSYPAGAGGRLRFSPEAADYFGEDGSFGPEASTRIRGNVLHGILAHIRVPEDLPAAVEAAVASGELPVSLREDTLSLLAFRLASVAPHGWFAPGAQVVREGGILAPDGNEFRPDRVILQPDGRVDIVDYNVGKPKESYVWQVRRYINLYRKLGYNPVHGFLWYLEEDRLEEVN